MNTAPPRQFSQQPRHFPLLSPSQTTVRLLAPLSTRCGSVDLFADQVLTSVLLFAFSFSRIQHRGARYSVSSFLHFSHPASRSSPFNIYRHAIATDSTARAPPKDIYAHNQFIGDNQDRLLPSEIDSQYLQDGRMQSRGRPGAVNASQQHYTSASQQTSQ
jgi:hypothetical protein